MLLTIVLTLDVEKPVIYDRHFFKAMEWSAGDAIGDVEVVVVSQRADSESFHVHVSRCPRNGEGYPVWDLFADVRDAWDQIHGEYVTFSHTEYLWGPDRLRRTLKALDRDRPLVAMGNLRRTTADQRSGEQIDPPIDTGELSRLWGVLTKHPWLSPQKPGPSQWLEDVFFVKHEWLEDHRFFEHGGRMPFQDVYDVMGTAVEVLSRTGRDPSIIRFDRGVCELAHRPHEKRWGAYTPTMRKWFCDHHEDWEGTTFLRDDLWERVLNGPDRRGAVHDFRRGPGGTITRWQSAFSKWLQEEMVVA